MERLNHVFICINIHDTKEFPKELKEVFQNLGFIFDGNLAERNMECCRLDGQKIYGNLRTNTIAKLNKLFKEKTETFSYGDYQNTGSHYYLSAKEKRWFYEQHKEEYCNLVIRECQKHNGEIQIPGLEYTFCVPEDDPVICDKEELITLMGSCISWILRDLEKSGKLICREKDGKRMYALPESISKGEHPEEPKRKNGRSR